MKQLLIIFSLLLYSATCSFGQNYRLIPADTSYYINDTGLVRAIYLDSSVVVGTDSLFYNVDQIGQDTNCPVNGSAFRYSIYGASMVGKYFGVNPNGWQYFVNKAGDSIMFNTQALLDDSFVLYKYLDGRYIEAKIISVLEDTVAGQLDSVKTIGLGCRDNTGAVINCGFNSTVLRLSKNHGLINMFAFGDLPNDSKLYTLSTVRPLTNAEVFDFNVGDVIQILSEEYGTTPGTEITTMRYMEVVYNTAHDTVRCRTYNRRYFQYDAYTGAQDDTTVQTYNISGKMFPVLPGQQQFAPGGNTNGLGQYSLHSTPYLYNGRPFEIACDTGITIDQRNGSCIYTNMHARPSVLETYAFIKGLGEVMLEQHSITEDSARIIYYKKGNETWGNYAAYADVENEILSTNYWSTYPNPAKDNVTFHSVISNNMAATIQLYNFTGQLMNEIALPAGQGNNEASMATFNLTDGLYVYHIKQGDSVFTGKVAIVK